MGMDPSTYKIMQLDLASLQSVRNFVASVRELGKKPDALVCNAAVWYPQDKEPRLTVEGYEEVGASSFLFARTTFPASWPNEGFRCLCRLLHGPNLLSVDGQPLRMSVALSSRWYKHTATHTKRYTDGRSSVSMLTPLRITQSTGTTRVVQQ